MPTDATGTPTALGIPKYNTSADAPSGLGFNAAMDSIDALIQARVGKPSGIVSGEVPVWNGTGWDRSSITKISPSGIANGIAATQLSGYPANGAVFLAGDGTWKAATVTVPAVRATNSTAGSSTVAFTALAFNTETFDTDTMHDTVTNNSRLTAKTAGNYLLGFNSSLGNASTQVQIRLNGTTIIAQDGGASNGVLSILYPLAVNDYVEVSAVRTAGAGTNDVTGHSFWAAKVA